jgi:hypothetical protein
MEMGVVMRRGLVAGTALVMVVGVTPAVSPIGAGVAVAAQGAAMPFDFDGDGYADLAVGVPGEDLRGKRNAGAVQVMYGSASGPTSRDQLWHQGRRGVKGAVEKGDHFGTDVASADFDADGYADLAIGIPLENIGGKGDAGAVQILYGSSKGLTARDQVWHQGKRGVPGSNESGDRFGQTLVAGDFDGDGFPDLAIGAVGEAVGSASNAGVVTVLRGSGSGLTSVGAARYQQGRDGVPRQGYGQLFGENMSAGDVNGDGRDDLAISVQELAGPALHLLVGGPRGLTAAGGYFFALTDLGLPRHGMAYPTLADLNGDGFADLALPAVEPVGTPGAALWRGYVAVLHGHVDGLNPAPLPAATGLGVDGVWTLPDIPGPDGLGQLKMAAGDFTGDGHVDLALALTSRVQALPIQVILGTDAGLDLAVTTWPLDARTGLTGLALSGGSHDWLVGGNGDATVGTDRAAGVVSVMQANATGDPGTVRHWHQDSPGIKGAAEPSDHFGQDNSALRW